MARVSLLHVALLTLLVLSALATQIVVDPLGTQTTANRTTNQIQESYDWLGKELAKVYGSYMEKRFNDERYWEVCKGYVFGNYSRLFINPKNIKIDVRSNSMVQELKPFPENQAINIEHTLLLHNAIHSTGIEGNQISDIDDASRIVLGDAPKQPYPLQDMNEIYDHYYTEREHNKQRKFPNRDNVQLIHKNIVFRSLHFSHHGAWRHGSQLVHIKGAKIMLPLSEEVPELMNRYFEYLQEIDYKTSVDPVVFACLAHADFIRIHPFADGNGRTGRILMNSMLQARGYPAVVIPRTEKELYKQLLNDHFELQKNGSFSNPIESPFCNYLENKLQDSINTLINMV